MAGQYAAKPGAGASIPGVVLADHSRTSYGYFGHRPQGTNDWLMIYTVSGEGTVRVDRETRNCAAGDAFILSPGIPHRYAAGKREQWEMLWVHFLPLPEWMPWLQLPRTQERLMYLPMTDGEDRRRLEDAFGRLVRDSRTGGRAERELGRLALFEIIILLYRQHGVRDPVPLMDERIERTLRYALDHLPRKHSLSELASLAGLSESRFCHLFKAQTGETFSEWIGNMRMRRAAKLLAVTARRIQDIAEETGFDSAYYFSRRFARHYGMSPSAYRAEAGRRGD